MKPQEYSPRDHLLGRPSGDELDGADERSLTDPSYFEALTAEEQLLVEEYVAGKLSPADRRDFEEQLGRRSELQERVVLERMSRLRATVAMPVRSGWSRMALPLAAAITLFAVGSVLYYQIKLNGERQLMAAREREWQARVAELEVAARPPAPPVASVPSRTDNKPVRTERPVLPIVATFVINPYTRGDSEESRLAVSGPRGAVELQFNLESENRFALYRVSVKTAEGSPVASVTAKPKVVQDQFRVVSATVPFSLASGRHFVATVSGIGAGNRQEPLASYAFVLYQGEEKR
jgi:hypothetical protein